MFLHFFSRALFLALLILLVACTAPWPPPSTPSLPEITRPEPDTPETVAPPALQPVGWDVLDGWASDAHDDALQTFLVSCRPLRFRAVWQDVCARAREIAEGDRAAARLFFEQEFIPHRVVNPDRSTSGLITGYYVPDLEGSRHRSPTYAYPLYRTPEDLLVIDLDEVYPELDRMRLRGRIEGRRVVPYWQRSEIDTPTAPLAGQELVWVNDPVERFFLHIQGSGRINLDDGTRILVNYDDQNGHPYRSIGKLLIERNIMTRDQMSMQNIRSWASKNPLAAQTLLAENPSYVFFRELDADFTSPPGALGVPLTARRSLAVDAHTIPLGAPVYLTATWPDRDAPLQRLMVAQDTGGAIKGAVRADFFWGIGDEAGFYAGRMKQPGRLWVLLPNALAATPAMADEEEGEEK
ncbi:MAG: murein transglycosylase A [Desulfuromonadales bacterium]|nr:murein transglycosylase A [Desulfuromonadales bacterium]